MPLTNKPISISVLSTDERYTVAETITAGDVAAYPITITFGDIEELPALPRLRFVSGDQYWDRDASDGVIVTGNSIEYTLEPAFYADKGLSLWVSFYDNYLFTPLQVVFSGIRIPEGNEEAQTSQPYPAWVSSAQEAESARAVWEAFDSEAQYAVGNKVYYLGSSYICHTIPPVGALPTDTGYWSIIVQKGDTGASGTIDGTTLSTLSGILAADGSTVAVASAAQAAAQAITDPGNLYTADNIGGQLQEVGTRLAGIDSQLADMWYPESTDTTDNVSCALFNEIDNGAEVSISNGTEGAGVVAAGRNLFDVSQVTASRFIDSGGNVVVGSNFTVSAKMRVPPSGQKITLKRCKSYIWYGADGTTVISYEYKSTTILRVLTVPANAAYIQFDCSTETQDMSDIVVVFGEYTAETLPALTAYVTPVTATINASGEAAITWETGLITLFVSVGTVSVSYVEPLNIVTQNDLSPYALDIVTRILLPNEIVAVTGEKMQVFLRGILESQSPYGEIIKATCDIGRLCPRYMEFEPTAPNVGEHTLTVQILDKNCAVKRTASTVIKVVAAIGQPASNKNVLLIGDSLTSDGERAIEMHRRLCLTGGSPAGKGYSNITFIGNKSDPGGAKWVGTGGWIWQNYTELVVANPFYNSGNNTIDFVNFCNNVGASGIDIVYVLLGWNQVGNPNRPNASDHSATITAAKVLIDKLKLDYPGVQVRIMGLQMPSPHGGLGANYGMDSPLSDYYPLIRSVHGLNAAYQAWANEVAYSSWVRFLAVAPCFDSDYNMPYNNADVNSRNSTVTEQKGSNGVHPALEGYQQIADVQFRDFIRTYCSS